MASCLTDEQPQITRGPAGEYWLLACKRQASWIGAHIRRICVDHGLPSRTSRPRQIGGNVSSGRDESRLRDVVGRLTGLGGSRTGSAAVLARGELLVGARAD